MDLRQSNRPAPWLDRTAPLLGVFFGVGLIVFVATFLTVHDRSPTVLVTNSGSVRSYNVLTHWLHEGYFHYVGLSVRTPPDQVELYRSSTGGPMVTSFVLEKLYVALRGHYSWRLVAVHNQIVSLLLSSLLGLLAYRVTRRVGLDPRLALGAGASVVAVMFTFPSNLSLYWEISGQSYALVFATVFLLAEERSLDGGRTRRLSIVQAVAAAAMPFMERIVGLSFISAMAIAILLFEPPGSWRRFVVLGVAPCLAMLLASGLQLQLAKMRFPHTPMVGSTFMYRSGLDGETIFYGDHLDIAWRRDVARRNWSINQEYLFRWPWVFTLGTLSTFGILAAYLARRIPRIVVSTLSALVGSWVLYAAVFSQSVTVHPYLYDVLLFAPLVLALFAVAPAIVEVTTGRTGTVLLVVVFCAVWYSVFQLRLYAVQYPMPGTQVGPQHFQSGSP